MKRDIPAKKHEGVIREVEDRVVQTGIHDDRISIEKLAGSRMRHEGSFIQITGKE